MNSEETKTMLAVISLCCLTVMVCLAMVVSGLLTCSKHWHDNERDKYQIQRGMK